MNADTVESTMKIITEIKTENKNLTENLTQDISERDSSAKDKIVFDASITKDELNFAKRKLIQKDIFDDYVQRAVSSLKTEKSEDKLLFAFYYELRQQVKSECGTFDGTKSFEEFKEQILKNGKSWQK